MTQPIRIIIVDDHPLIKEGIKQILSFYDDMLIVGEGSNGQEALDLIHTTPCDILLLDINMPIMTGLEVVKQLNEEHIELPILLLTVENDYHTLKEAIDLHINGYMLKESAGVTLISAIREIYQGGHFIDPALTKVLFTLVQGSPLSNKPAASLQSTSPIAELSLREKEILSYLVKDLTNKEIASRLFLSEKTIRNSLTKLFKKLEVTDRMEAKAFALKHSIHLSEN